MAQLGVINLFCTKITIDFVINIKKTKLVCLNYSNYYTNQIINIIVGLLR